MVILILSVSVRPYRLGEEALWVKQEATGRAVGSSLILCDIIESISVEI